MSATQHSGARAFDALATQIMQGMGLSAEQFARGALPAASNHQRPSAQAVEALSAYFMQTLGLTPEQFAKGKQ